VIERVNAIPGRRRSVRQHGEEVRVVPLLQCLDLDVHVEAGIDNAQGLSECGDRLAVGKSMIGEGRVGELRDGDAVDLRVVVHDGDAVRGDVDVQLNPIGTHGVRQPEGRQAVLCLVSRGATVRDDKCHAARRPGIAATASPGMP
jgi:hypothetical protein